MINGMSEQDIMAYIIFGIMMNFVISFMFGVYLSKNIGMQEMMQSKGEKEQSPFIALSLLIPFVKVGITLYRVAILQLYFLNKGHSHKDFWIYLTHGE